MAVTQRTLPLRCVICRTKILQLNYAEVPLAANSSMKTADHTYKIATSASLYSVSSGDSSGSSEVPKVQYGIHTLITTHVTISIWNPQILPKLVELPGNQKRQWIHHRLHAIQNSPVVVEKENPRFKRQEYQHGEKALAI